MDIDIPEAGLHVVAVGSFLILELDPEQHRLASQTTITVLNADLDQAVATQVAAGAEIVQERWEAPVGAGTRLRHPDGLVVEYLEHRPTNDDVPQSPDRSSRNPPSARPGDVPADQRVPGMSAFCDARRLARPPVAAVGAYPD